jgi:hypothetical protein
MGVDGINFVGDLTEAMKAEPERIDWGLSEVSRVTHRDGSSPLGISVEWEGDRRLDIDFNEFELR